MNRPIGIEILREVLRSDWRRQPDQDLSIFKQTPCPDVFWKTQEPTVCYDKHSAYLACAASVRLGVGNYEYQPDAQFPDGASYPAGLWYVVADADSQLPGYQAEGWYYSPLLRLWKQAECSFSVRAAYLWPETHCVLKPFYHALRDLRCEDEQACKWLYRRTFGMLAHWPRRPDGTEYRRLPEGFLYRPDWYNLIRAELKARMYYHALQVEKADGVWPVSMHTDELGYDRRVTGLRVGEGIGAFREVPA